MLTHRSLTPINRLSPNLFPTCNETIGSEIDHRRESSRNECTFMLRASSFFSKDSQAFRGHAQPSRDFPIDTYRIALWIFGQDENSNCGKKVHL